MFDAGYDGIIPVIYPRAPLCESALRNKVQAGKCPGVKLADGTWTPLPRWQQMEATRAQVEQWIADGASFGLRTTKYRFVDIDVDVPEIVESLVAAVESVLGQSVLRRVGRPPRVAIPFRAAEPLRKVILTLRDAAGTTQGKIEILADGNQAVVYGDHPATHLPYRWYSRDDQGDASLLARILPAELPRLTLELLARLEFEFEGAAAKHGLLLHRQRPTLAIASLPVDQAELRAPTVARLREAVMLIPNDGDFDNRDEYIKFFCALRGAAGTEGIDDARELALEFASRWKNGCNDLDVVRRDFDGCRGPYRVGWGWLACLARAHGFVDAADDFTTESPAALPEYIIRYNERYAMIRSVANAILYTPRKGTFSYMPFRHWQNIVSNELIARPGTKPTAISKEWIASPGRRTYEGIVFDPSKAPLTGVPSQLGGLAFNTWPGLAFAPSEIGSCALFLDHIHTIVCDGNGSVYSWVIMWLAAMVQQPGRLPGTALALRGAQGAGKTIIGQIMGTILGEHLHTTVSGASNLTDKFNADLEGRILIQVEEAFFAGDRSMVGRLKDMITNPIAKIERKGIDKFSVANCARLLITSNEGWVVPASEGERRFMVLTVSDARARDREYFGNLMRQMDDDGGHARLLHHLLYEVVVDWDVISQPMGTDSLRDQQIQSLPAEKRWFLGILNSGTLPGDAYGFGLSECSVVCLSYINFMRSAGEVRRASDTLLGILLKAYGVEHDRQRVSGTDRRSYVYLFPPLHEIRATFSRQLATPPEWDDVDGWQATGSDFGLIGGQPPQAQMAP